MEAGVNHRAGIIKKEISKELKDQAFHRPSVFLRKTHCVHTVSELFN